MPLREGAQAAATPFQARLLPTPGVSLARQHEMAVFLTVASNREFKRRWFMPAQTRPACFRCSGV